MKRFQPVLLLYLLASVGLTVGCSDDDTTESASSTTLSVQTAEDIPADADAASGPPGQGPPPNFTFYSLTDGDMVAKADSNSTQWDIALAGTTLLVNGGTSGPGQGAAQVLTGAFDDLEKAPEDSYQTDGEAGLAIPAGSGNSWYTYTGQTGNPPNAILPIPGRIIALRTAEGNYAKVEILSYYKGNPDTSSDDFASEGGRHYTFRYVVQPDGSRNF